MTREEKDKLIYGEPVAHDIAACNALREYENQCKPYDAMLELKRQGIISRIPTGLPNMNTIAQNYNTTIEAMKEHWPCIERENKQ